MASVPRDRALSVSKLSTALGAVVKNFQLRSLLAHQPASLIEEALREHLVVFCEDQSLTVAEQRAVAVLFGDLHVHPVYPGHALAGDITVLENDSQRRASQNNWHADVTYVATPPRASILFAEVVPEVGGDTIWANMCTAYEALSDPMKQLLAPLQAVHDFAKDFPPDRIATLGSAASKGNAPGVPPVSHPVIRREPDSGRAGIYVNSSFTTAILGLTAAESDCLLRFLFEHVAKPEFQVRWRWKPNDVAIWDNRWTQHYAVSDYFPHRRRMRRATILDEPAI